MDACHACTQLGSELLHHKDEIIFVAEWIQSCSVVGVEIISTPELEIIFKAGFRVGISTLCLQSS